ncbi:MAG: leucine zipper domain-containing protein, partial [Betaproteobacteria bacterium]
MNTRKNARLTFARRFEMVQDITQHGLSQAAAARAQGVSVPTTRKWLGRYLARGEVALRGRSSRPRVSPRALAPAKALAIVESHRHRRVTGSGL